MQNNSDKIPYWRVNFSEDDIVKVSESIRNENISMGSVTEELIEYLESNDIQSRPVSPDLDSAKYLDCNEIFPNSQLFGKQGLILPCGPDQPIENVNRVLKLLQSYK